MSSPLIPSALAIALFCGALAGTLAWCAFVVVRGWVIAWRTERDLANEFLLRVALDDAQRLGMLPDDTQ